MAVPATTTSTLPLTPEAVLQRVNELVPVLRARARETEKLRRMHPDTLRDLTDAGVFKLTLPADAGGLEADLSLISEVLAQIARGCPSTSWVTSLITGGNFWTGILADEGAAELLATPDVRVSGLLAPTGKAMPVEGGYSVSGTWLWNTGGVRSHWVILACMTEIDEVPTPIAAIARSEEVEHHDTWDAAGMAGTATNKITATDVFVPAARTIAIPGLASGVYQQRRYADDPYYNVPALMFFTLLSAPAMLGMARGAMDAYMEKLPGRAITYTNYAKAAEAPLTHHQLAHAQFDLEIAEMYMSRLCTLFDEALGRAPSIADRVRARAWLGQVATHARACVNQLFEASGASQIQHSSDIQRYFRDVNTLNLHALIQPTSSDELYGRHLVGLEPNTTLL